MLRRILIRLRFMPVIGWLFDRMPAALNWGWMSQSGTFPPAPTYVPPRDVSEDSARVRFGRAIAGVLILGLIGLLIGGTHTGIIFLIVASAFVLMRTLRSPPRSSQP
jgi:hypothetical protein